MHNRIPLPAADNPQFKDVMDYFQKLQDMKMKAPLIQAQTQEAQAKALKANWLAKLMGEANSDEPLDQGQTNPMQSPATQGISGTQGADTQQPSESQDIGSGIITPQEIKPTAAPTPSPAQQDQKDKAKNILLRFGVTKETPNEQEAREKRTAWQNAVSKNDADIMKGWSETITAGHAVMPALENIQQITANPAFQSILKNPQYFGYDVKFLQRQLTPEQQGLITSLKANTKTLWTNVGDSFKGAFKQFEKQIYDGALIDETDTLPQMIAKNNTLLQLKSLVTARLTLADNIVRSSQGQISPANALEIADKQIDSKKVAKQISDRFEGFQKEQLAKRQITVIDPDGGEHVIDKSRLEAAKAKYPNLKVKGEATNAGQI